jgi:hypothetical protein
LRQDPGRVGDRHGEQDDDIPRPEYRDPVLDGCAPLRPFALEEVEQAGSAVGPAEAAGLRSRDYIAKLEAGDRISPSMPALERIAKALGVKVRVTQAK